MHPRRPSQLLLSVSSILALLLHDSQGLERVCMTDLGREGGNTLLVGHRTPIYEGCRRSPRYSFTVTAELLGRASQVRTARVVDLSIGGSYLAMQQPFSKGALLLLKLRSQPNSLSPPRSSPI